MGLIRDLISMPRRMRDLQSSNEFLHARLAASRGGGAVASGVDRTFGRFAYEQNTELRGDKRWKTFESMESDPHVKGALRSINLPLVNAEWAIEPASDDERDVDIAEFVSANLLRESSDRYGRDYWTQTSWKGQRLGEVLDMLRTGFSVFHKSFRPVGGKVVFDRLQWLEPATIDGLQPWELSDTDEIIALRRKLTVNDRFVYDKRVKANRLALYVHELRGARYEGRPFVRSMYGAWLRKDHILRWSAIWAQRVGAPVPIGSMPSGWPPDVKSQFIEFMQSIRSSPDPEAYFVGEHGPNGEGMPSVTYAGADTGEVDRMRGLIDGENKEIGHAGGNSSDMLGETESGSRALGASKQAKEFQLIESVADVICEYETHGVANIPGLIEELVDLNFAGVQAYPKLTCSKIDPDQGLDQVTNIVASVTAGVLPKSPELAAQVAERFGLNLPDDAFDEIGENEPLLMPNAEDTGADGSPPGRGSDDQTDEDASAVAHLAAADDFKARIAGLLAPAEVAPDSGASFRPRTVLEARCLRLGEISRTFRVGEADIVSSLRRARGSMHEELLQRLADGKITRRNVNGQRRSRFGGEKAAVGDLRVVLGRVGDAGVVHVGDELERFYA